VIVQCILLLILILIAFLWAFCYKRRCFGVGAEGSFTQQVAALARKVSTISYSKDLPPSYSKVHGTLSEAGTDNHATFHYFIF
jgi:ABC-type uncharacterized transport system permease subunit